MLVGDQPKKSNKGPKHAGNITKSVFLLQVFICLSFIIITSVSLTDPNSFSRSSKDNSTLISCSANNLFRIKLDCDDCSLCVMDIVPNKRREVNSFNAVSAIKGN